MLVTVVARRKDLFVDRRTIVFVTRTKHVIVARVRRKDVIVDPGELP